MQLPVHKRSGNNNLEVADDVCGFDIRLISFVRQLLTSYLRVATSFFEDGIPPFRYLGGDLRRIVLRIPDFD